MIRYDDISKANETIVPMMLDKYTPEGVVKTPYVPVNQRIKAFRMVYPNGRIETEVIERTFESVVIKACIYDESDRLLANAHASEMTTGSSFNQFSMVENCETSAVGRALGLCGFGIAESVGSYEEVNNAIAKEEQAKSEKSEKSDKSEKVSKNQKKDSKIKEKKQSRLEEARELSDKEIDALRAAVFKQKEEPEEEPEPIEVEDKDRITDEQLNRIVEMPMRYVKEYEKRCSEELHHKVVVFETSKEQAERFIKEIESND